ncbi:protein zerknuellt 1-like [Aethina tumida]|uniref:protein zerknuellt 1-like n=1 Tax=Aethina tumida TaxID=116153 RepID=UPI002147A3E0|nr:protein zerknuellt 1-like [Aethina tumida]
MNVYETLENDMSNVSGLSEDYRQINQPTVQERISEQIHSPQRTSPRPGDQRRDNKQLLSRQLVSPLNVKRRAYYSEFQLCTLEDEYLKDKYISKKKRIEIGTRLNISERQVKVWYQNKRNKEKKHRKKFGCSYDESDVTHKDDSDNLLKDEDHQHQMMMYRQQMYSQINHQPHQFNTELPMQNHNLLSVTEQYTPRQDWSRENQETPIAAMQSIPELPSLALLQQYYTQGSVPQENGNPASTQHPQQSTRHEFMDGNHAPPVEEVQSILDLSSPASLQWYYPQGSVPQENGNPASTQHPQQSTRHEFMDGNHAPPVEEMQSILDLSSPASPQIYYTQRSITQESNTSASTQLRPNNFIWKPLMELGNHLVSPPLSSSSSAEEVTFSQETRMDDLTYIPNHWPTTSVHDVQNISPRSSPDVGRDVLSSDEDFGR